MATVTGLTAARMLEIENASIVDARKEDDELILTTHGGDDINVGNVKGDPGDPNTLMESILALVDPVGVPKPWLTATPPNGYAILDGSVYSPTACPQLFAQWGNAFGGTTAAPLLPDLRGKTIFGFKQGDSIFGTLRAVTGSKDAVVVAHDHSINHDHASFTSDVENGHTHGVGSMVADTRTIQTYTASENRGHSHYMQHTHGFQLRNQVNKYASGSAANALHNSLGDLSSMQYTVYGNRDYTDGASQAHEHYYDATHNHSLSGTSGAGSSHSHTIDVPAYTGSSGETGVSGSDKNVPPNMTGNWIVRLA